MKKAYAHYLLVIFVLLSTLPVFSQNDNEPIKLGSDVMFTIFEVTGGGPKMVLLLQKKDSTEVSLEEFKSYSYQDKPGIPEGFKELKLEPGNYTFDNFFQSADFDYYGRYSQGRYTLFFHPNTVILHTKLGQIVSKSWYEFSETDLKIESEEYFDNGKISAKGFVEKDGSKTGEWKYYDKEDDHLTMSGTYENDERVGVWKEYDSNGKVKEEVNFSKRSEGNAFEYFSKKQKN
ncbi:toxin-antitoxin system YwqK family antitoxin [Gaetbulibacter sp. PBL-D1]|uniref:toxin-antitoxin system YwqK family antitoxin n=1 Tax=Gaetbulibacter sp. PBL-D1 TaxID=3422594 RepID=UPI003D2F35C0